MFWRHGVWWVAVAWGLQACSPTFNWREVDAGPAPWAALMPCKPERAERGVPLLGPGREPVVLHMLGCEAGGLAYALAALPLPAGESAEAALARWQLAGWATLGQSVVAPATLPEGWQRRVMSAAGGAVVQQWTGAGVAPDGRRVQVQWRFVAQSGWLMQAAAYGPVLSDEAVEPFFSGLRLR